MQHKLINTGDYLLIVDESEIKEGDLALLSSYVGIVIVGSIDDMPYTTVHRNWIGLNCDTCYDVADVKDFKKIISHLPLNNSPILEGVDLLPPFEDEVEKIANQEAEKLHDKSKHDDWDIYNQLVHEDTEMIKIGYNKAKEKYKYTEEDLRKAIDMSRDIKMDHYLLEKKCYVTFSIDEIIQSLQQPKVPVGFKCEMEKPSSSFGAHMANFFGQSIPKTTTNSQGLTQWVGEYIY